MGVQMVAYRYHAKRGDDGLLLSGYMPVYEALEVIANAEATDFDNGEIEGFPFRADGRYFHHSLIEKVKNILVPDLFEVSGGGMEEGEDTHQTEGEGEGQETD